VIGGKGRRVRIEEEGPVLRIRTRARGNPGWRYVAPAVTSLGVPWGLSMLPGPMHALSMALRDWLLCGAVIAFLAVVLYAVEWAVTRALYGDGSVILKDGVLSARPIGPCLARTLHYQGTKISGLRVEEGAPSPWAGWLVCFDYAGQTVAIGRRLCPEEAQEVVAALAARLPAEAAQRAARMAPDRLDTGEEV
jgi:hypothetical protein